MYSQKPYFFIVFLRFQSFRLAIMQRYGVKRTEGKNCDPKLTELVSELFNSSSIIIIIVVTCAICLLQLKMWDRKLYHKTFVDEIFGGELVTFQECLQCGNVRRSHEEFLDLSLPIRVVINLIYSFSWFKTFEY